MLRLINVFVEMPSSEESNNLYTCTECMKRYLCNNTQCTGCGQDFCPACSTWWSDDSGNIYCYSCREWLIIKLIVSSAFLTGINFNEDSRAWISETAKRSMDTKATEATVSSYDLALVAWVRHNRIAVEIWVTKRLVMCALGLWAGVGR